MLSREGCSEEEVNINSLRVIWVDDNDGSMDAEKGPVGASFGTASWREGDSDNGGHEGEGDPEEYWLVGEFENFCECFRHSHEGF